MVAGGEVPEGAGAFYPPTVVAAANELEIAQEEVFGPVVTVTPFEDEKDAIRLANDVRYGLMATVWTGDPARGPPPRGAHQVGDGRDQHAVHRLSGDSVRRLAVRLGRELALESLDLYLETKSVVVSTGARPINLFGL